MAQQLFISDKTVRNHISNVMQKLNVDGRSQAKQNKRCLSNKRRLFMDKRPSFSETPLLFHSETDTPPETLPYNRRHMLRAPGSQSRIAN
ncbi:LuxR C-terminal-related transcriptional regulator [Paenibacillus cellulosilyticus]|uniref:LuxR C-terminal-related transcriptional regulator n=1 Tax=Paenibacillus cellulosilyticus TaxID=375489 RepID=UPI003CCFEB1D